MFLGTGKENSILIGGSLRLCFKVLLERWGQPGFQEWLFKLNGIRPYTQCRPKVELVNILFK